MRTFRERLIAAATLDVGQKETGPHPFEGPFPSLCLSAGHPSGKTVVELPWCVGAVNKWAMDAHSIITAPMIIGANVALQYKTLPWPYTLSCDTLLLAIRQMGLFHGYPAGMIAKPGELVFWNWSKANDPQHVSVVSAWCGNGSIVTVGGDERLPLDQTGGKIIHAVRSQIRDLKYAIGFSCFDDRETL